MDVQASERRAVTRVLVVEPTWWWREALLRVLEHSVEPFDPVAIEPETVRDAVGEYRPDVAIVDIDLPAGAKALHELRESDELPCLAVSSEVTAAKLTTALSVAASFVVKQELEPVRLCELVTVVQAGDTLLLRANRRALGALIELETETPARKYGLTDREAEVVALLARGLSNAEIATVLHLSRGHVKKLVSRALRRLGVRNRTEAALVARREGMTTGADVV